MKKQRRTRLIHPRLQLTVCATFIGLSLLCIVVQFSLMQVALADASVLYSKDTLGMVTHLQSGSWHYLIVTAAILIPATLVVGLYFTFRLLGPLVRLEHHLGKIARGEDPGELWFRKSDYLQELPKLVNQAIARLELEARNSCQKNKPGFQRGAAEFVISKQQEQQS